MGLKNKIIGPSRVTMSVIMVAEDHYALLLSFIDDTPSAVATYSTDIIGTTVEGVLIKAYLALSNLYHNISSKCVVLDIHGRNTSIVDVQSIIDTHNITKDDSPLKEDLSSDRTLH